jgi:hypothetical protein
MRWALSCEGLAAPSYRVAAEVLRYLLPVEAGMHHETLRSHTLKAGEQLLKAAIEAWPTNDPETISLTVDSTAVQAVVMAN